MFGISLPEILLVLAVVLIIFGPEKLPELARTLGKFSSQLKRNSDQIRKEFYNTIYTPVEDIKSDIENAGRKLIDIDSTSLDDTCEAPKDNKNDESE